MNSQGVRCLQEFLKSQGSRIYPVGRKINLTNSVTNKYAKGVDFTLDLTIIKV
jgi:hypothetical protein